MEREAMTRAPVRLPFAFSTTRIVCPSDVSSLPGSASFRQSAVTWPPRGPRFLRARAASSPSRASTRLRSPRASRAKWRASMSPSTSRPRKPAAWIRSCTTAWARASRRSRIRASTSPRKMASAAAPSWARASAVSRASKTRRSPGKGLTTPRRPRRSTSRAPSATWSRDISASGSDCGARISAW